ncbi:Ig-like V-type domain-containing protein FAM187A [Megalopta genalis]|uniref:Ig-like V-type domain-containing protein FAM187A n=1 Tax=Megalopta genalis TaxID=115081 RepID=UPI003FD5E6D5
MLRCNDSHTKRTELLIDTNEFEYPRANGTLRIMHKQLWEEYYECLKRTYNEITTERMMYPIALIALEGTTVILKCPICISPMETYMNDNFEWYFDSNNSVMPSNETNKLIEESDNIIISSDDKKLIIYNIKPDQAGRYWCKLGDTLSTVYYLSIEHDSEEINIVHPDTAPHKPHAVPEKMLSKYDLLISTTWTTWTQCSTCDIVGRKNRYGYCFISSRENIKRRGTVSERYIDEQTETIDQPSSESADQTTNLSENVISKIKMALHVFRNQLPCKSEYVPNEIRDMPDVKNRKTELMIKYCKVKCSKNEIFEVRDKHGNVLESANNSAGIYSVVQGMPIPSPPVIRTVIFKKYETKAILICPGNLNTDVPITWKVNNELLHPSVIEKQSEGRIHINAQTHIIVNSLKFEDTNIYSCWQKNEIAGIIKLQVTGETELQVNYSVMILGGILIVTVFLIVFWRAFEHRKRFTIR